MSRTRKGRNPAANGLAGRQQGLSVASAVVPGTVLSMRLQGTFLAAVLIALPLVGETTIPDPATLPYRAFADLADKVDAFRDKERLDLRVRVTPKDPADTAPIRLEVRSRSGVKPVEVAADGGLVDFPTTPALREENPPVVANRPKGTLQLGVRVVLKRPEKAGDETVGWYQKALDQANAAAKKLGGGLGFLVPKSKALLVEFPKSEKGRVVVTTGAVETVIEADEKGSVGVALGNHPAGSRIRFEPAPTSIQPD
jgi:hypothetical protein